MLLISRCDVVLPEQTGMRHLEKENLKKSETVWPVLAHRCVKDTQHGEDKWTVCVMADGKRKT